MKVKNMKRIFTLLLAMVIISLFGCSSIKIELKPFEFESEAVNNDFHNSKAGGLLAYTDYTLFINNCIADGSNSIGLYAVNKENADKIHEGSFLKKEYGKTTSLTPFYMYQYKNNVFLINSSNTKEHNIKQLDLTTGSIIDSDFKIKTNSNEVYLSDNLIVWQDYNDINKLHIVYNGKESFIDERIDTFDIVDDKIYYINSFGNLYCYNPKSSENTMITKKDKTELANELPNKMICCNNYCYFISAPNQKLCCYHIYGDEFDYSIPLKEEIYSINSYKENVFVATESGIYKLINDKCTKISDLKTRQIYIFDDSFIYTHNTNGEVKRINLETKEEERIL